MVWRCGAAAAAAADVVVGEVGGDATSGSSRFGSSVAVLGEERLVGEEMSGASSADRPLDSLEPLNGAGRWAQGGVGSSSRTMPCTESFHSSDVSTLTPSFRQQSFPFLSTMTS